MEKMMACGQEIHGVGEVVLVSETHVFSLDLLPLSRTVWLYGDNHSVCPCCVVTMIRSNINRGCGCLQTAVLALRAICMDHRTQGPCQPEVSHMVSHTVC